MKEGKLFYLLRQLSTEEYKGLKKAVNSPVLNTNQRLVVLYDALRPAFPNFENSDQYRKKLFHKVYPNEAYNHGKLHKLFTAFSQLIVNYLLWQQTSREGVEREQLLLKLYRQRQMIPFFQAKARELSTSLEEMPYKDLEYYQAQIFLNEALYFNPFKDKYDLKDEALDKLTDSVDYYFALAKARYGISLRSRERILAKPGTWRFMEVLREEQEGGFMSDSIVFQLYDEAFLMLEDAPEFSFTHFEKLLFDHISTLRYDAKVLFYTGLNYINRQINRGTSGFSRKAFEWYRFGLSANVLMDMGQITEVTFGNVVISACREKEYDWASAFMISHSRFLHPDIREDARAYNTGLWHYFKQEYDAASSVLLNYDFNTTFFLRSRLMAIRALFEHFLLNSDYYDLLMHQISAFEIALIRTKAFSKAAKEPASNTISILKMLARKIIRLESTDKIKKWFEKKINTKSNIAAKQWLIDKVNKL